MFGLNIRYELCDSNGEGHHIAYSCNEPMLGSDILEFIEAQRNRSDVEIIKIEIRGI